MVCLRIPHETIPDRRVARRHLIGIRVTGDTHRRVPLRNPIE